MTDRTDILLWTDSTAAYREAIAAAGLEAELRIDTLPRRERPSPAQLAQTQVLLAAGAPAGVLSAMPRLRWVQSMTAGVEGWLALPDLPAQLLLTCARGTHRESMPENIVAALFHIAKPYAIAAENQKQSRWVASMAQPLNGKTLGILGLGAIGQDVARIADTLGMRVIGTRRRPAPMPHVAEVLPAEASDTVLAQADFLLLLLPATPSTVNFIDAARLAKMKRSAWLLNFGRGHLIVDNDLIAAVEAGHIAGAILDVFRQEPLPAEHPFWRTERIAVLPHIGGGHPQRDRVVAALFTDNLRRFLRGQALRETVDRVAGY